MSLSATSLIDIRGVAADSTGNVYFADTGDHRVRRISPAGVMTIVAGTGQAGLKGDGGPATQAQLNSPYGVAADSAGTLYIADLGNGRVRRVAPDGTISTIAGGGTQRADLYGVRATDAILRSPRNVAFDPAGILYISDFADHRVYRLSPDGRLSLFAGNGAPGYGGDGGLALLGQLNSPAGLAIDRTGAVLICDSGNHLIRRVINGLLSTISIPNGPAFLNLPTGVAVDPSGFLYVASSGFDQLVKVPLSGQPVVLVKGARDVASDSGGSLYFPSATAVRKLTPGGQISTLTDGATSGGLTGDLPAAQTVLQGPIDVKIDAAGVLYLLESDGPRVRRLTASGTLSTFAGDGQAGLPSSGRLQGPLALAVDGSSNVYIADAGNQSVRRSSAGGGLQTVAGTGTAGFDGDGRQGAFSQLNGPAGVAADGQGNLFIADTANHRIRRLSANGILTTIAGDGTAGFAGDGGPALFARMAYPRGLGFDFQGNLYVADSGNHRVRAISPNGVISTAAGNGMAAFQGDGGTGTAASLSSPSAVATDGTAAIWIADTGNQRIRRVTSDGRITTVAGTGQRGYSGDGAPALSAQLSDPAGLAIDPSSGVVYVADRGSQRVRKLVPGGGGASSLTTIRVLHSATLSASPVAPGMLLTIQGPGIGPAVPALGRVTSGGLLDTRIGDLEVHFDGQPAPLLYAEGSVINVQVPYRVAGQPSTSLEVAQAGTVRAQTTLIVVDTAPGLFTDGNGSGPVAALNEDGSVNSAASPAPKGTVVSLYATGEGQTNPAGTDGRIANYPFPVPVQGVTVLIGGQAAEVTFVGSCIAAPGLLVVNVRIPAVQSGAASVSLVVGSATSAAGTTIYVK